MVNQAKHHGFSDAIIVAALREAVAAFDSFNEPRVVLIRIVGVTVSKPLMLGNVEILSGDDDTIKSVIADMAAEICNQKSNLKYDKTYSFLEDRIRPEFLGLTFARTRINAEADKAAEFAVEECRMAIDLLRYVVLSFPIEGYRRSIGISGDVPENRRVVRSVDTKHGDTKQQSETDVIPFDVNETVLDKMERNGVFDISEIIRKKEQRTNYEIVILRAVHWLAAAQSQNRLDNRLLNSVTCLETLLKPEKADSISNTIAEGVAYLTREGIDARKARKEEVKSIYDKRSKITHEGATQELNESNVNTAIAIAVDMVQIMLRNRVHFTSHSDFLSWLRLQKLGAVLTLPPTHYEGTPG